MKLDINKDTMKKIHKLMETRKKTALNCDCVTEENQNIPSVE